MWEYHLILRPLSIAARDIVGGFGKFPLWRYMAFRELRLRYARSFIGPFWITISMGLWVIALSLLYGGLFGAPLEEVAPFITLGVVIWTYLQAVLTEGSTSLMTAKGMLEQMETPISTFVWLVLLRNIIVAGHHMMIFVVLIFLYGLWPNMNWLWLCIGIPILLIVGFAMTLFAAVLTPRFRDLAPLITNFMTVGFFLSPVMWRPSDLQKNQFIVDYNPFTHLLAVFREPLLGRVPDMVSIIVSASIAVGLLLIAMLLLGNKKHKIIFWL